MMFPLCAGKDNTPVQYCTHPGRLFGLAAQKAFFSCTTFFGIAEALWGEWSAVFEHGEEDSACL
jgi:hypothetical protein